MTRFLLILFLSFNFINSHAWNMKGHQVIAQIAYDNLTPAAKNMCHHYLPPSKKSLESRFLTASIWMDLIKFKKNHDYDALHYVDIPYSNDGTTLPFKKDTHAVWAINHALKTFASATSTTADKKLSLKILLHVVGDIHQPLHAITRVSTSLPRGDLGGNLYPLGRNKVGANLHQYWDRGAGFFKSNGKRSQVKSKANVLEKKWSCTAFTADSSPAQWAQDSHALAIKYSYQVKPKEIPNKKYKQMTQNVVQKQVVIAGCRLASLLNDLAKNSSTL